MSRIVLWMSLFLGLALGSALVGPRAAQAVGLDEYVSCVESAAEEYQTCTEGASYFGRVLCFSSYVVDFWACAPELAR